MEVKNKKNCEYKFLKEILKPLIILYNVHLYARFCAVSLHLFSILSQSFRNESYFVFAISEAQNLGGMKKTFP